MVARNLWVKAPIILAAAGMGLQLGLSSFDPRCRERFMNLPIDKHGSAFENLAILQEDKRKVLEQPDSEEKTQELNLIAEKEGSLWSMFKDQMKQL